MTTITGLWCFCQWTQHCGCHQWIITLFSLTGGEAAKPGTEAITVTGTAAGQFCSTGSCRHGRGFPPRTIALGIHHQDGNVGRTQAYSNGNGPSTLPTVNNNVCGMTQLSKLERVLASLKHYVQNLSFHTMSTLGLPKKMNENWKQNWKFLKLKLTFKIVSHIFLWHW